MAQADQITFTLRKDRIKEASTIIVVARFRDRATAADVIPTNVKYRLDCLTTGAELVDWTTVTPAASVTISIPASENEMQYADSRIERKQLTVAADFALSTQFIETLDYEVRNAGLGI